MNGVLIVRLLTLLIFLGSFLVTWIAGRSGLLVAVIDAAISAAAYYVALNILYALIILLRRGISRLRGAR